MTLNISDGDFEEQHIAPISSAHKYCGITSLNRHYELIKIIVMFLLKVVS